MKACIAAAIIIAAFVLVSCASQIEESRTTSQYDGDWRALMRDTQAVQQVQGFQFDCAPFTESFFVRVKDGMAAGFMEADENYSFTARVDKRGRFAAKIPTNTAYTYKDAAITRDSSIVLVLEGELARSKKSGLFVIGDEAIDSQGCITQVQFVAL